jgi:predicted TIM-barrel fold metal-dependent hydrolase
MLDAHIHIMSTDKPDPEALLARMRSIGMEGGMLLSWPPASFPHAKNPKDTTSRLNNVMEWCRGHPTLFPAFWMDPTEDDAVGQVEQAHKAGVAAFKMICANFHPSDKRAMKTYAAIAQTGKPILFHSGILWDGQDSSRYNRPAEFEAMIDIKGLRFALAHISWPWVDECLAVYGKVLNCCKYRNEPNPMFIDATPGTPVIYRKEALTKLYTIGYDIAENVFYGSDTLASSYSANWADEWVKRDKEILDALGRPAIDVKNMFEGNFRRFLTGK